MGNKILSIDPSITNLGYCVMTNNFEIIECDLLKSRKENWDNKCKFMWAELINICHKFFPKIVYLEFPEYWSGSVGYQARESGSVFKLTFLCGGIFALLSEWSDVRIVTPSKWKGQLSKKIVKKRLKRIYPDFVNEDLDHNVVDAIGIGHYMLKDSKKGG